MCQLILTKSIVAVSCLILWNSLWCAQWEVTACRVISFACMLMAGYIVNDIIDIEMDKISSPYRPLPSGDLTVRQAKLLYAGLLGVMGVCLILDFSWPWLVYLVVYALAFVMYSKHLKRIWWVKNVITGLFFASPALFALLCCAPGAQGQLLALFAICFAFTIVREMLMDMHDRAGDEAQIPKAKRPQLQLPPRCMCGALLLIVAAYGLLFGAHYGAKLAAAGLGTGIWFFLCRKKRDRLWVLSEYVKIMFLCMLCLNWVFSGIDG